MFIKNDSSLEKRYYNGKIGVITDISKETVTVQCANEIDEIVAEKEEAAGTRRDGDWKCACACAAGEIAAADGVRRRQSSVKLRPGSRQDDIGGEQADRL